MTEIKLNDREMEDLRASQGDKWKNSNVLVQPI